MLTVAAPSALCSFAHRAMEEGTTRQPAARRPPLPPSGTLLHLILWGCARDIWPEMERDVRRSRALLVQSVRHLHLHRADDFVRRVYAVDNIASKHLEFKVLHLMRCPHEILSLSVATADPEYRIKAASGTNISRRMEALKRVLRSRYHRRVHNYKHDIIVHGSDNEETHTRHIERLVGIIHTNEGGCAPSNLWACAAEAMLARGMASSDWMVVGSSVLEGLNGRRGNDIDVLVRPHVRANMTGGAGGATYIANGVQIVHPRWLAGVGDDQLLDDPRWHAYTSGALWVKHVHPELAMLRMHSVSRPKDRARLRQLCTTRPFAWDRDLLKEAARRSAPHLLMIARGAPCPEPLSPEDREQEPRHAPRELTVDGCVIQNVCSNCHATPGCAFCRRNTQAGRDVLACYNLTRHANFCPAHRSFTDKLGCQDRWLARTDVPLHDAGDVETCARLKCFGGKQRCRVRLIPWLIRNQVHVGRTFGVDDHPRADIFVKLAILEVWKRNESWADEIYVRYMAERTRVPVQAARVRWQIFRGLFEAVRMRGLDWQNSPIAVKSDFTLLDGSHRVAAALAFGYSHVELLRTRCTAEARDAKGRPYERPATGLTMANMKRLFRHKTLKGLNGSGTLMKLTAKLATHFLEDTSTLPSNKSKPVFGP